MFPGFQAHAQSTILCIWWEAHGTDLVCSYLFSDGTSINTSSSVVCQSQSGDIHCPHGSFLFVDGATYGHNENATQQDTTKECSLSFDGDICYEETLDFLPYTTEQSITNIQVPNRNVTCSNGLEVPINYALINHMCVPGMDRGGPIYLHGLTLNLTWISNHLHSWKWVEIT